MDTNVLDNKFARIGARLKLADRPARVRSARSFSVDIQTDRHGEFFEVVPQTGVEVSVLDVQPADRHLLLLVRDNGEKRKFLCGHDERHWFVAGIPEAAPVGTVRQAKEALKPLEVRTLQARQGLRAKARSRRKNAAYRRQGEWFFVSAAAPTVDAKLVIRNEPLSRGIGSKPHWAEFCFRQGGELVYVCRQYPRGLGAASYRKLLQKRPEAQRWDWRAMRRNADVYVKGRISHPDHRVITLHGWHRVLMNTEGQAKAMRNVAFLD